MRLAVVIPATAGREANLERVLAALREQSDRSLPIVVVDDGGELGWEPELSSGMTRLRVRRHKPGREQPRNVGARWARLRNKATHFWFLDSDVVPAPGAVDMVTSALAANDRRVLVCPYDWLEAGLRPPAKNFELRAAATRNDPRWPMFEASPPEREYRDDLSAGLACWSGNLIWPADEFLRVGGFWSELHHGRCEDGELGLRAVSMQVPISFIPARGYHLWHPINFSLAEERNRRDVPMLDRRHPWVQGAGVFLSERDGAAFDVQCDCGEVVHTNAWWSHAATCPHTSMELHV